VQFYMQLMQVWAGGEPVPAAKVELPADTAEV